MCISKCFFFLKPVIARTERTIVVDSNIYTARDYKYSGYAISTIRRWELDRSTELYRNAWPFDFILARSP